MKMTRSLPVSGSTARSIASAAFTESWLGSGMSTFVVAEAKDLGIRQYRTAGEAGDADSGAKRSLSAWTMVCEALPMATTKTRENELTSYSSSPTRSTPRVVADTLVEHALDARLGERVHEDVESGGAHFRNQRATRRFRWSSLLSWHNHGNYTATLPQSEHFFYPRLEGFAHRPPNAR